MPVPDPKLDQLLRTAIEQTRLLRLRYRNKDRVVEPHDYGQHNGVIKLLTWQIGGSSSGPLPNWRWMETDQISDAQLLDQTFRGGPPHPFRQTPQMGQTLPQSQTGREYAGLNRPIRLYTPLPKTHNTSRSLAPPDAENQRC